MATGAATTVLEFWSSVGSIVTPLLILALSAVGWRVKSQTDRRMQLEDKLRDSQIETYLKILEPIFIALTPDEMWTQDKSNKGKDKFSQVNRIILSQQYKNESFKLSLIGTDGVVKSYNDLMQFFYNDATAGGQTESTTKVKVRKMLDLLGEFLLQIRISMGNEHSKLTNWDMIEGWVKDARDMK